MANSNRTPGNNHMSQDEWNEKGKTFNYIFGNAVKELKDIYEPENPENKVAAAGTLNFNVFPKICEIAKAVAKHLKEGLSHAKGYVVIKAQNYVIPNKNGPGHGKGED